MIPAPKAILFDCDGTLLLTEDLHFRAISHATAAQGTSMPRGWYSGKTGLGRRDLFAAFAREFDANLDVGRLCKDSIAITPTLAALARINPPVAALARRCAGHLPMAVCTNSETPIVTSFLRETGLLELFGTVVTVDDVRTAKPAPDMFLLAAMRLGVEPGACLVLEDSDQGLAAAKAAGMRAIDVRADDVERALDRLGPVACAP